MVYETHCRYRFELHSDKRLKILNGFETIFIVDTYRTIDNALLNDTKTSQQHRKQTHIH